MDSMYLLRERIEELYEDHSRIFDKGVQFLVTLIAFYLINANVGFMEAASNPVITVALSVICTFFQPVWTLLVAAVLILAHMYEVSLGVLVVVALIFFVMYVFFIRMTPNMALVVLLTPILFHFHIPFVLPVACGLMTGPVSMVAMGCGIITYYMLDYVKLAESTLHVESMSEILDQMTVFIQQIFTNREMWVYIITFMLCTLVVYAIHRLSVDHAWIIAIAAGVVVNIVVVAGGDVALGVTTSYGSLFIGNAIAAVVGLILMFFFFSVDYGRSVNLQYEDDDYYYYVKAVPKLSVTKPDVSVTRINARQDTDFIGDDADEVDEEDEDDDEAYTGASEDDAAENSTDSGESPRRSGGSTASGRSGSARSSRGSSRSESEDLREEKDVRRPKSSQSGQGSRSSQGSRSGSSGSRSGQGSSRSSSSRNGQGSRSGNGRSSQSSRSGSAQSRQSAQSAQGSKTTQDNSDTPEVEDVNETLLDMSLREDLKMK